MPDDFLTTKEVAEHLGIHEKQVYALVKAGKIPASRVTGKWLFPRRCSTSGSRRTRWRGSRLPGRGASGSKACCSPPAATIRSWTSCRATSRRITPGSSCFPPRPGAPRGCGCSTSGTPTLRGATSSTPRRGEYNVPHVKRMVTAVRPVVANLLWRDLGFVTAAGNPLAIRGFEDLGRSDVRLINRQGGRGDAAAARPPVGRPGDRPGRGRGLRSRGRHALRGRVGGALGGGRHRPGLRLGRADAGARFHPGRPGALRHGHDEGRVLRPGGAGDPRGSAADKGQAIIRDFGKEKFGAPLFFPNSDEWKQAQSGK